MSSIFTTIFCCGLRKATDRLTLIVVHAHALFTQVLGVLIRLRHLVCFFSKIVASIMAKNLSRRKEILIASHPMSPTTPGASVWQYCSAFQVQCLPPSVKLGRHFRRTVTFQNTSEHLHFYGCTGPCNEGRDPP